MTYTICELCNENIETYRDNILHVCKPEDIKKDIIQNKEEYDCRQCNENFGTLFELINHGKICCVCKKITNICLITRDSTLSSKSIIYGEVNTWNTYDICKSWDLNDITENEMKSFENPISVRGTYLGTYLSRIKLKPGILCPDCFNDMDQKREIVHLWTH
jgi:hypothetical protein